MRRVRMQTRSTGDTKPKMDIGLPDKMMLTTHASGFEIIRRWLGWQTVSMTAFAIIWDAFLYFWYLKGFGMRSADPISMLFPLFAAMCGAGLTYNALAGWLNRTRIRVDQGTITIRHEPVPWPGNTVVDGANITQLYSSEHVAGRRRPTVTYEVHALTVSGSDIKLLSGLDTSEQAIYVEQEIERHLGIKDRPVPGQL